MTNVVIPNMLIKQKDLIKEKNGISSNIQRINFELIQAALNENDELLIELTDIEATLLKSVGYNVKKQYLNMYSIYIFENNDKNETHKCNCGGSCGGNCHCHDNEENQEEYVDEIDEAVALYCDEKFIGKNIRSANMAISEEILKKKIMKDYGRLQEAVNNLFQVPIVEKDLNIRFDLENLTFEQGEYDDNGGNLIGFHNLNGLSFLGGLAGGDWEAPVFFIVYYDGKNLRAYIPTAGNIFNLKYKTAFGSEGDSEVEEFDEDKCFEYFAKMNVGREKVDSMNFKFDWEWIEKDILAKIQLN